MPIPTFSTLHSACCSSLGYTGDPLKEKYAAAAFDSAFTSLHELPPVLCGSLPPDASKAAQRKWKADYDASVKARIKAVNRINVRANAAACGFDPDKACDALNKKETWGIILGLLIVIIGGPMYLFLTVTCAVGSWIIEEELEERYGPQSISKCAAIYLGEKSDAANQQKYFGQRRGGDFTTRRQ